MEERCRGEELEDTQMLTNLASDTIIITTLRIIQ